MKARRITERLKKVLSSIKAWFSADRRRERRAALRAWFSPARRRERRASLRAWFSADGRRKKLAALNAWFSADPRRRIFFSVMAVLLVLGAIILDIWVGTRRPDTSADREAPLLLQVTAAISPSEGITLEIPSLGVRVYVPPYALDIKGYISATPREPDLFPGTGEEAQWSRPRIINLEVLDRRGRPISNVVLNREIEVYFHLDDAEWQFYLEDAGRFDVQHYDETALPPRWFGLPKFALAASHELCGRVSHLSLIALAVKGGPGAPTPEAPYQPYLP